MENLKTLSDLELHKRAINDASQERKATLNMLYVIREIERRSLHLERGFPNLHSYCVEVLKYSDAAAQRRIQSMRLLREIPETENAIKEGKLNLTNVAQAQGFFNRQAKTEKRFSTEQKKEILTLIEGQSTREAEKTFFSIVPESKPIKEKVRVVSATQITAQVIIDEELQKEITELKIHYSHINPKLSYTELLRLLVKKDLKRIKEKKTCSTPAPESKSRPVTRYIKAQTRREVLSQNKDGCSYIDPLTKKRCGSRHQLQIDHIISFGKGGGHEISNLRLLCSAHNRFMAIKAYGAKHMGKFVKLP